MQPRREARRLPGRSIRSLPLRLALAGIALQAAAGAPPPDGWLDWLDAIAEAAPLGADLPPRRGWIAASFDLVGWLVPYALVVGGGDWQVAAGQELTGRGLGERPILRLDRPGGVLILGDPAAPPPGSFGIPTLPAAEHPGPGAEVWVATAGPQGAGLLAWSRAEIVGSRDEGLLAGPRLRIRMSGDRVLLPGAVVATAAGALASLERAVSGAHELFDCVLWPPPGTRGLVPGVRFRELATGLPPRGAGDAWAEGEFLLAAGRAQAAQAVLDQAWAQAPDCWPVAALLALAAAQVESDPAVAAAWTDRAIALAPGRQEVQAVAMGVAERWRDAARRRAWLDRFTAQRATGPDLTLGWALDAIERRAWTEALEWLRDPELQRVKPGQALRETGRCLTEVGRSEEAVRALQEAAVHLPADPVVFDRLCMAARQAGVEALAVEAGRRATQLDPGSAAAYQHLGVALAAWGKAELAGAAFEQALRLKPDDVASLTDLGKLLVWARRPAEAEPLLRRAIELSPDNFLAHLHLAEAAVQRGELGAAESSARRAVEQVPDDPEGWYCLAGVQHAQGRGREARETLEQAIARAPQRRDFWIERVRWETETRDPARVLAVVGRGLDRLPDDPQLMEYHGWALLNLGRVADAESFYRETTVQHPRDAGLRVGLSQCLRRRGDLDGAIGELEKALERVDQPGLAAGHLSFLLGLRSVLAGAVNLEESYPGERWEEYSEDRAQRIALQAHGELAAHFEELQRQRPNDPYLDLFIAQAWLDAGEPLKAELILRRRVGAPGGERPTDLMALELLADLMRRSGALEEAERIGDWLVRVNPYSEMGYAVLGTALVNRGDAAGARERIARGLRHYPDSNVLGVIDATALAREERWEEATAVLDRIAARQPAEADVLYLQAYCHFRTGRLAEAQRFAQVAAVRGDADRSRQARALLALIERRQAAERAADAPPQAGE